MIKDKYQPVIGLEIHVELNTRSKMFCSCPNDSNPKVNSNICPICLGHPGTLPVINKEAVRKVIKTGLALGCKISKVSKFDRKNYFYPDLPKGYQTSQFDKPLCENGKLEILGKIINITRIHLEEDAGKLTHTNKDYSLVDFNRAGVPLMELVTEPDIRSAKEAVSFAKELQSILRYLDISDADMEKGHMRIEVNTSLSKNNGGEVSLSGTRTEIKNLNSFKSVEGAIMFEVERQSKLLDNNEKVIQETRGWDADKGITISQRKKEEAHDYHYLPDPDLPILTFDKETILSIKKEIPELPKEKRLRLAVLYSLKDEDIEFLIRNQAMSSFFEEVVAIIRSKIKKEKSEQAIKLLTNYLTTDLKGIINKTGGSIKFTPNDFSEFILLIDNKKISSKIAKKVLAKMFERGEGPLSVIEKDGLSQMNDEDEIMAVVEKVIQKNKKAVTDYSSGKENALQFLIGQVMAETRGRADLLKVKQVLENKIKN